MNKIDMRFDEEIFKNLVGQTFHKYRCDPFVYTPSVTQIVGLYIGDEVYKMSNVQEPVDYYGNMDDVAICRFIKAKDADIRSALEGVDQIDTPINGRIEKVVLVNEHQQVFENGTQTYDVWLTRGVIFTVDGREISFEKQNWPYSEEINIERGYNLIDKFGDVRDFSEDWDPGIKAVAVRENVVLQ